MLDEPTTGLDLLARDRFLGTLRKLAQLGKTIILVTHHVEEIIPEIQRVILLRHGCIMLAGDKGQVLTSENLSAMFGAPIQVRQTAGFYTAAGAA
jgi:iron complex transport system ATP-binding protein